MISTCALFVGLRVGAFEVTCSLSQFQTTDGPSLPGGHVLPHSALNELDAGPLKRTLDGRQFFGLRLSIPALEIEDDDGGHDRRGCELRQVDKPPPDRRFGARLSCSHHTKTIRHRSDYQMRLHETTLTNVDDKRLATANKQPRHASSYHKATENGVHQRRERFECRRDARRECANPPLNHISPRYFTVNRSDATGPHI